MSNKSRDIAFRKLLAVANGQKRTALIEEYEPLTPVQKSKVVREGELPPCVGNPGVGCWDPIQTIMISGFDGKMRCPPCQKIHTELVFNEAGNSAADSGSNGFVESAGLSDREKVARAGILKKHAPRGGWTTPSSMPPERAEPRASERIDPNQPPAERRADILAKYQKGKR